MNRFKIPPRPPNISPHLHIQIYLGSLPLTFLLSTWFIFGAVTITSSKLLLSTSYKNWDGVDRHHAVSAVTLTLFQFLTSTIILNLLLHHTPFHPLNLPPRSPLQKSFLLKTSFFYTLGFLLTSYSFSLSTASFTETVKASEPITSAIVAVYYGIEKISAGECTGIGMIVTGVLMTVKGANEVIPIAVASTNVTANPGLSVLITLSSNLCFSLRNLNQTLLSKESNNFNSIQFFHSLSQLSFLLILPIFIYDLRKNFLGLTLRSLSMLILNGSSHFIYNLSSTLILSRVSMIQHATYNAARRLFAILVTSFYFGVVLGFKGVAGVMLTVGGFGVYGKEKGRRRERSSIPR
ncbi:hypothetical protein TrLO_g5175 [Triparma laevis f. longispina]|uniref:Sugar phosphate transporter domain-containing protein n=1 Tax=Triparma laevis f. longispina TaxID=1714387 RepID=A0A9W7KU57_9STRA|nr:hypothetical protein TrLO_g5175 [Triparma laevis f. longispina]